MGKWKLRTIGYNTHTTQAQMASTATHANPTTVDDAEVARFSAIADEWWDTRGKFAPLHRLNPVRIEYLRDQIIRHFSRDGNAATPLNNLSLVDIGCGGGLISEPMARLGASVTGIDASSTNISVAALHAQASNLTIDYRATTAEALAQNGARFDIVFALEIIEHVSDTNLFYDALVALVKPGGVLILSTLNRTAKSYALGIIGAEYVLRWLPRGTHSWKKFIRPSEMAEALTRRGFTVTDTTGITFSPLEWKFSINPKDLDVNYMMVAKPR
jgi:2-polyprenyl-6-hydroxyphenyl methylase / 3-demethylubiquinone-9 3-methyltransferase